MKINLMDLSQEEMAALAIEFGEPKFRGKQIFEWIHRGAEDFDEMTNLSKSLREKLREHTFIGSPKIEEKYVSRLDGTRKYLLRLWDGNFIESVLMKYEHGYTICVSSQVGCRMGCRFCASTLKGRERNLSPGEILGQVLCVRKDLGERISNIVMMGIGEPLDNFDNVTKFLEIVSAPGGINIGQRHITLSSCGIADNIKRLADMGFQITLTVSLHASDDETRSRIMPINKKYNIEKLMDACDYYAEKTGRRVSFEYTLISGVNDMVGNADKLAELLKGKLCHVNLIPVNRVSETGFDRSDRKRVDAFRQRLERHGIVATVRREMGSDINAACGQLRNQKG